METIGILGAGAWGTALALVASRAGKKVLLQAREQEVIDAVRQNNENTPFLPGVPLNPNISVTNSFEEVLSAADVVLLVIPAQFLRASCKSFSGFWKSGMPAVVCAKGIEQRTGALMSEILAKELPQAPIAVLSGPTFAAEAALEKPTAVTLACADKTLGKHLVETLGTLSFRPYYSSDIISVEIGGAVKNVMAIAAGIVEGKKLGDNARAALITRGLAEISRLGRKSRNFDGVVGLGRFGADRKQHPVQKLQRRTGVGRRKKPERNPVEPPFRRRRRLYRRSRRRTCQSRQRRNAHLRRVDENHERKRSRRRRFIFFAVPPVQAGKRLSSAALNQSLPYAA